MPLYDQVLIRYCSYFYLQVISGSFPIAQLRTPLAAIEYIAQRIHIERSLRLVMCSVNVEAVLLLFGFRMCQVYRKVMLLLVFWGKHFIEVKEVIL